MDQVVKTKWLAALRSGNYKQTKKFLRNADGFCCLGVLCDIVDSGGWRGNEEREGFTSFEHWDGTTIPHEELLVDSGLGFGGDAILVAERLAEMNDGGSTFKEIADYIEKNL